jgi:CubicO group peptidase (beta-lactamase class C family)
VADSNIELHSFMMLRHGHVVGECWWSPYRRDATHSLYSLSKSFTSTAVGFAVSEEKIKVTDRVVDFFPEQLPPTVSDNLAALRIQDLLSMSVGHKSDSLAAIVGNVLQSDWVKTFLSVPIEHPPGSVFLYDTGASFMLSAIVQRATGEQLIDYLQPRLFVPLNIRDRTWEASPLGINTGGWGLSVTTESLAKFGQLYLQKGQWNGKQLLPMGWVNEATSFKIQQQATWNSGSDPAGQAAYTASLSDPVAALAKLKQSSDWYQGYAYQFWRCRHNAFRGDGAFGQLCVVMPDQDAVVVITAETGRMQDELNLIWDNLLPAIHNASPPRAAAAARQLKSALSSRSLPPPRGTSYSPTMKLISGKQFTLEPNGLAIQSVSFLLRDDVCLFSLENAQGAHEVKCGMGKWADGLTTMPGEPPALIPYNVHDRPPIRVAASGAWADDNTFEMQWRFYETPHHDTVTCRFSGSEVSIEFLNSITQALGPFRALRPETRPVLKGHF